MSGIDLSATRSKALDSLSAAVLAIGFRFLKLVLDVLLTLFEVLECCFPLRVDDEYVGPRITVTGAA